MPHLRARTNVPREPLKSKQWPRSRRSSRMRTSRRVPPDGTHTKPESTRGADRRRYTCPFLMDTTCAVSATLFGVDGEFEPGAGLTGEPAPGTVVPHVPSLPLCTHIGSPLERTESARVALS